MPFKHTFWLSLVKVNWDLQYGNLQMFVLFKFYVFESCVLWQCLIFWLAVFFLSVAYCFPMDLPVNHAEHFSGFSFQEFLKLGAQAYIYWLICFQVQFYMNCYLKFDLLLARSCLIWTEIGWPDDPTILENLNAELLAWFF